MVITVDHLTKSFGPDARVVDDVSFNIQPGEMFFLLGPSGCGKTTVLRMLAGLISPDSGSILFDDWRMNQIPPQARNTAMVFQNYAIWPHLTVQENVAYGPKAQGLPADIVSERVHEALRIARLENLAARKPAQLSGGQQQRVALARALAVKPNLILLDEPLSNLDARLRAELRDELERIHHETRTTSLYVTHDQEEALALADRIAVMNQGRIEQIGSPVDIYERPANEFVARFMGDLNVLETGDPLIAELGSGNQGKVGFRPEAAEIVSDGVPAIVKRSVYRGSKVELTVETKRGNVFKLWVRDKVEPGQALTFKVDPKRLIPL